MVADLMPASSPGSRSTTSALKPARSAQRRYMRTSIWAQSWDSVPPAPGWMETMAFFTSWAPDRIIFSSNSSNEWRRCRSPSSISAATLSSPSSTAISQSRRRSSTFTESSRQRPTRRASPERSWTRLWARRLSSQKAGEAMSASIRRRRSSLAGRSKVPPEVVEALLQLEDVALQLAEHKAIVSSGGVRQRTLRPRPSSKGKRTRRRTRCRRSSPPGTESRRSGPRARRAPGPS